MKRLLLVLPLLFALYFLPGTATASHIVGGDFNFECVGPDSVRVNLNLFRSCAGVNAPVTTNVNVTNSCGANFNVILSQTSGSGNEVSMICPSSLSQTTCNNGVLPGYQIHTYSAVVAITPSCNGFWDFSFSTCCRSGGAVNLVNSSSASIYISGSYHGQVGCNNSPAFQTVAQPFPLPFIEAGETFMYDASVLEIDGDSHTYAFVTPLTTSTGQVAYAPGYSATNPMLGISIDQTTGLITIPPQTLLGTYILAVEVKEYDLNGTHMSTIVRDFVITVLASTSNTAPINSGLTNVSSGVTQVGSNRLEVVNGQTICFDVVFSDSLGDSLLAASNAASVLPGATVTITGNNPTTVNVCWTANLAGYHEVSNYVQDQVCPVPGINSFPVIIRVTNGTSAGPDLFSCNGQPAQLQATGGSTFTWSVISGDPIVVGSNFSCNPCANPIATPSVTTYYQVTSNLGSGVNTDIVAVFVGGTSSTYSVTQPSCSQGSGSINISTTGNSGPFQYSIDGGNTFSGNNVFTGLSAGTYNVQILDSAGCTEDTIITLYGAPTIDSLQLSSPTCTQPNGGSINVNLVSGLGPFMYSINGGQTFQNSAVFTGLAPGTYNVVVQSANGCNSNAWVVNLTLSGGITINNVITWPETCPGSNDGGIHINAGPGNFSYSIDAGQNFSNSPTFSNLAPGTYPIVVMNSSGCIDTAVAVVGAGTAPIISSVATTNAGCNGQNSGSINITATGGNPPLFYSIDGGTNFSFNSSFTNLGPGTYPIVVSDSNGCSDTTTVTIIQGGGVVISSISGVDPTCAGNQDGEIYIVASSFGGQPLSYSIDGGATFSSSGNFSNLGPGTYTIVVTDSTGCQDSGSVTLVDPSPISALAVGDTLICPIDSATLSGSASGGTMPYTYQWNPGNQFGQSINVSPGTTTTYTLVVTDVNGCSATSNPVVVTVNPPTGIVISNDTTILQGDSVTICASATNGQPPYIVQWNNGVVSNCITVSPSQTTTYTAIASDFCGNEAIGSVVVTVDSSVSVGPSFNTIADFKVYPNPFRGETNVSYTLPSSGQVSIEVIDLLGKVIATPETKVNRAAGNHQVTINSSQAHLTPGVYFVRLTVNDQVMTKRIIQTR